MVAQILIVGAGAIGAFYASRLAHAKDVSVSCICRSNYRAVSANGFQVTSPYYGNYVFRPANVFSSPSEAANSKIQWDYILVSTKALPDVADDSSILEGLAYDHTAIVLVQNGLGVELPYSKRFPKSTVLSGVTIASVAQPEHGKIKHNRWSRITLGPYLPHTEPQNAKSTGLSDAQRTDDLVAQERNNQFVAWLKEGGIKDAETCDHATMQLTRWHKIAINAAMNPSSVLSGGTTNERMSNDPELQRHLLGVINEVLDTAPKVVGVEWPENGKYASAERIIASTQKNSSGSVPSMQIDWQAGKKMELEVILGQPIKQARAKALEMPRMQALYALLRMAQENRDGDKSKL